MPDLDEEVEVVSHQRQLQDMAQVARRQERESTRC